MTTELKQLAKIIIVSLILIFAGCQKDDDFTTNPNSLQPELVLKKLYRPDFSSNINIENQLKKFNKGLPNNNSILNQNTSLLAREIYIEEYDFTIDDEIVNHITYGNYESYTFPLFRSTENGLVENLLLSKQIDGSYKASIIAYDLTEQEKEDLTNGIIPANLTQKTTIQSIESKSNGDPIRVDEFGNCYYIDQIWEENGATYWTEVKGDCPEGYNNDSLTEDNQGGGGSASTGDNDPGNNNPVNGSDIPSDGAIAGDNPFNGLPGGNNDPTNNNDSDCLQLDANGNCIGSITFPVLTKNRTEIKLVNNLTPVQNNWWLNAPQQTKDEIINYLNQFNNNQNDFDDAVEFVKELIDLNPNDTNAIGFLLQAKQQDKMSSELDDAFLQSVNQYLAIDTSTIDPVLMAQISNYLTIKCAVLRYNNPSWSDLKIYWEASKDIIHIALDGFGMIPVVGEIADLTNGVLYLIEGDGVNATLSFAATIPIGGWTATGTKYAIKIIDASQTATTLITKVRLTWKVVGEVIDFGSRNQLRKVLGITASNIQAHHLIPWSSRTKMAVQRAAKSGSAFHMNEALNGIAVAAWRNQPNHTTYNNVINGKLDAFRDDFPNATPQQCYTFLTNLIQDIRTWVINNPNSHLNDIVLP